MIETVLATNPATLEEKPATWSTHAGADAELERRLVNFVASHAIPIRDLQIRAAGGEVTLRGVARSFYHKQLCTSFCQHVAGVMRLENLIEVSNRA